jgi:hypothetical protein
MSDPVIMETVDTEVAVTVEVLINVTLNLMIDMLVVVVVTVTFAWFGLSDVPVVVASGEIACPETESVEPTPATSTKIMAILGI